MLAKRRQQEILSLLSQHGEVKIQQLADRFSVSSMTIRRDLEHLETDGLLQRTYGGAVTFEGGWMEPSLASKKESHAGQKEEIAKTAAQLVEPGMSVILDAGSTALALAKELVERAPLRVVTTDLDVARELGGQEDIEVFVTGGQVRPEVYSLEGDMALRVLESVFVDIAFVGCDSFTEEFAMSRTVNKSALKQSMMKAASKKVLLADSSKFGHVVFSKVAPLSAYDAVVVDSGLAVGVRSALLNKGIRLLQPDGGERLGSMNALK